MPTYINNTSTKKIMAGPGGERFPVQSGESIVVPFFVSDANFTKTFDTPISSESTATTSVTLGAAADHDLHPDTRRVAILQISDTVTVRPQLDSAVPILLSWTSSDPIIQFLINDFPCEKLRISGSGTITVMEYRS